MNRTQLNLALLVVVAGLGATVYLSQKKEEKGAPLTALKQDAITRVALEHPGKPTVRLQKQDGAWKLVEPVQADTDPFEINGILGLAEVETRATLDAKTLDKAELGLSPPQYSVTLDDVRIGFGGSEPIKSRRYVQSGETVALVDDPPGSALDADYSELVSRAVVPEKATLTRVELPGLTLAKNAEGVWTSPDHPDAPKERVAKIAEGWQGVRALWNAAEPEEGSSGEPITLTLADGQAIHLLLVAREPQLVLSRKDLGVRYTLSKALVNDLLLLDPPKAEPAAAADGQDAGATAPAADATPH